MLLNVCFSLDKFIICMKSLLQNGSLVQEKKYVNVLWLLMFCFFLKNYFLICTVLLMWVLLSVMQY